MNKGIIEDMREKIIFEKPLFREHIFGVYGLDEVNCC